MWRSYSVVTMDETWDNIRTIADTSEEYLLWLQVERRFAESTIIKYRSVFRCFLRDVGNVTIRDFSMNHIFRLKQVLHSRKNSEVFIGVTLACIKGFLRYSNQQLQIPLAFNPNDITLPKRPRREVVFLTSEEIKRFRESINIRPLYGLRFRTLVEVILGTGMRISEVLSLDRTSIDFVQKEARIIGKGNKERVIYFNDDAISWVKKYLERREDEHEAVFVTTGEIPRRLRNQDLTRYFKRQRILAGINKRCTPHILRHCFATNLAMNACPFTEIKNLLGHERLDTTIRFYVGLTDQKRAREAHRQYLRY